ncbi:unnamed protein product, partial [Prorocentrum cordatum]
GGTRLSPGARGAVRGARLRAAIRRLRVGRGWLPLRLQRGVAARRARLRGDVPLAARARDHPGRAERRRRGGAGPAAARQRGARACARGGHGRGSGGGRAALARRGRPAA